MDATLPDRIGIGRGTTGWQVPALAVHGDGLFGLHPRRCGCNDPVRRLDDMAGRPIILDQVFRPRAVILFELADETDRSAREGIDVLVVVAHREEAEPQVGIVQRAPGDGGDQGVLFAADILIFVDQNPAIALDQRIALCLGLGPAEAFAVQLPHGRHHDAVEIVVIAAGAREAGADQPHRQRMAGRNRHRTCILSDQMAQPSADLGSGVAVIGQH